MSASLRGLHPEVRNAAEWALAWARHFDVPVQVTSTLRPWEQQARLRARWERWGRPSSCIETTVGLVCPANAPGDSAHEWGLAWDSVTEPWADEWWAQVRELAGFSVPRHDIVHAEVPGWRDLVVRRTVAG